MANYKLYSVTVGTGYRVVVWLLLPEVKKKL